MPNEAWSAVDAYFEEKLVPRDSVLEETLRECERAGLPAIQVTPTQGRLLQMQARLVNAKRILEIGTLGGYSTICLARGLAPGGRVITLEIDRKHAEVARANFVRAKVEDRVQLRLGPALETLPKVASEVASAGPFDLVFIDADKPSNPDYFAWALKMARVGSVIIIDNVVRDGAVADAKSTDASVLGVRQLMDIMATERRILASAVQTVGGRGYDGFAMAVVVG